MAGHAIGVGGFPSGPTTSRPRRSRLAAARPGLPRRPLAGNQRWRAPMSPPCAAGMLQALAGGRGALHARGARASASRARSPGACRWKLVDAADRSRGGPRLLNVIAPAAADRRRRATARAAGGLRQEVSRPEIGAESASPTVSQADGRQRAAWPNIRLGAPSRLRQESRPTPTASIEMMNERIGAALPQVVRVILSTVEMHTGGEPNAHRPSTAGPRPFSAKTLLDKRREGFAKAASTICGAGPDARAARPMNGMYGAPAGRAPNHPEADLAVLFMHNEGFSNQCAGPRHHRAGALGAGRQAGAVARRETRRRIVRLQCPLRELVTAKVAGDGTCCARKACRLFAYAARPPSRRPAPGAR